MTERQLSRAVVALAETLGWRVFTVAHSKAAGLRSHSAPGFPDLICIRGRRMLAVELKVKRRKPTPAQVQWLAALDAVPGVEAHLLTEKEWLDGTVERMLRGQPDPYDSNRVVLA